MLDKLKDILSKIKPKLSHKADKTKTASEGGKLWTLWLFVLPVLCGAVLGRFASSAGGYALSMFSGRAGMVDQSVDGNADAAASTVAKRGLDDFITANPFKVSPQKPETPAPAAPVVEQKPVEPPSTLDDVVLKGTLPGVGGWFERNGELKLLLIGKNIDRYRLTSVKYDEAVFRRGRTKITKVLAYGPVGSGTPKPEPTPKTQPRQQRQPQPQQDGSITAATNQSEGSVPAEIVNSLVQNPFDELKRIRMRPNDKAGGLEVQWIQNDSILKRLGVQRGDVIRSVNGIPFTNMGDIANSINSLMNSERFDVEVVRGGKSTPLRYVVK